MGQAMTRQCVAVLIIKPIVSLVYACFTSLIVVPL